MSSLVLQRWDNSVLEGQIQAGISILHAFTSLGESIFCVVDTKPGLNLGLDG